MMLVITAAEVAALAPMPRLIEALRDAFRRDCQAPLRHSIDVPGGRGDRVLLCMPAFEPDGTGVIKLVGIYPDNAERQAPTVHAVTVVFADTGEAIAVVDATTVTKLRTAAASALASTYLSRTDSTHLAVIGTGSLAPYMAMGHCAVRPIRSIKVVGRNPERAAATVAGKAASGFGSAETCSGR